MKIIEPRQSQKSKLREKTYFFSDAHLGLGSAEEDRQKELRLIRFLNFIQRDAAQIYIVGDLFDPAHGPAAAVSSGKSREAQPAGTAVPVMYVSAHGTVGPCAKKNPPPPPHPFYPASHR